jgi:hypothetical protein
MSQSHGPPEHSRSRREVPSARVGAQASSVRDARPPSQNNQSRGPVAHTPRQRSGAPGLLTAALAGAAALVAGGMLYLQYAIAPALNADDQGLAKCLPSLPLSEWAPRPQPWAATLTRSDYRTGQDISPDYSRSYIATACGIFQSGGLHMIVRSAANTQGQAELLEDVLGSGPAGMMCYSFTGLYAGSPLTGSMVWYHGGLVKSATGSFATGQVSQWCHERMGF